MSPFVVGSLDISGNGASSLATDGVSNNAGINAGELLAADLYLYVSDPTGYLGGDALARRCRLRSRTWTPCWRHTTSS